MTKIIVFRFMSNEEFTKFQRGETLMPRHQTKYLFSGAYGEAKVHFMPCNSDSPQESAKYSYQYLSGVVSAEICALFEAEQEIFTTGLGRYADPYGSFFDCIWEPELYLDNYNNEILKLLCYCDNFDNYDEDRIWQTPE